MTRKELVRIVVARTGARRALAAAALDAVTDAIADALAAGGSVTVRNFGRFETFVSAPTRSVDPRTGQPLRVPPRRRIRFAAAPALRRRLRP